MDSLRSLPVWAAALLALLENALILVSGVSLGAYILRRPAVARVMPDPGPVSTLQRWLALNAVVLNSAITLAGWALWRLDIIRLDQSLSWRIPLDFVILILLMDLISYAGHAIAHIPVIFGLAHSLHHRFVDSRPLTLFALHPLELLGFGAIWIVVLSLGAFNIWSLGLYTAANLLFGIFGHLGVEPLPLSVRRSRLFYIVATPTMHAQHHFSPSHNLGFYTTIWDRLFRTLDPTYDNHRTTKTPTLLATQ